MKLGRAMNRIARQQVAAQGAPVAFVLTTPGEYDETTDTWTEPTETRVEGHAVRVRGNPIVYERLSLVESEAPTLLFTPNVYGEVPPMDATTQWGGHTYTVKDVNPTAPDGTAILSRVVVKR